MMNNINYEEAIIMYKISFYVPIDQAEKVKNAMFKAGAGKIGNYSCCSWQVLGKGQYLPLAGSHPYRGEAFRLEQTKEYKVEMVCADENIHDVMVAFREAHPYEEPAYHVLRLEDF